MVEFLGPTEALAPPGKPVIVAASGGADSTALVVLLEAALESGELHGVPVLAHLDHSLRPDSRDDRRRVEALATEFGRSIEVETAETGSIGRDEDSARRARRAFLIAAARRVGARTILLGHHADDQAETVLHRIFRGTGIGGLSAMSRVVEHDGIRLVRPLLFARRAEIQAWLRERGREWAEDPTNTDTDRARGHLRHILFPALPDAIYPAASRNLVALSERAREANRFIEEEARKAFHAMRIDTPGDDSIALSRAGLQAIDGALLHPLLGVAMAAIDGPAPTGETRRQIERALVSGRGADLPGGVRLHVGLDRVELVVGQSRS